MFEKIDREVKEAIRFIAERRSDPGWYRDIDDELLYKTVEYYVNNHCDTIVEELGSTQTAAVALYVTLCAKRDEEHRTEFWKRLVSHSVQGYDSMRQTVFLLLDEDNCKLHKAIEEEVTQSGATLQERLGEGQRLEAHFIRKLTAAILHFKDTRGLSTPYTAEEAAQICEVPLPILRLAQEILQEQRKLEEEDYENA